MEIPILLYGHCKSLYFCDKINQIWALLIWKESWKTVKEKLQNIKLRERDTIETLQRLFWRDEDWKLYNAFKRNVRQRAAVESDYSFHFASQWG